MCVCAGHPAVRRYWQETGVKADWVKPDESSGLTVETTAYVLLTVLLKVLLLPVTMNFLFCLPPVGYSVTVTAGIYSTL